MNRRFRKGVMIAFAIYLASSVAIAAWLMPAGREQPPITFPPPADNPKIHAAPEARNAALRRARVWAPPAADVDLAANPADPGGLLSQPIVRCRYQDGPASGTTAKFDCVLSNGEVVKVKYGYSGEIHAEIAATRLLAAAGFGADRMFMI